MRSNVAFLSSWTRTTCRRGSAGRCCASRRRFDQASQSVFAFRQMRVTVSLPTAPLNNAASTRRRRRGRRRNSALPLVSSSGRSAAASGSSARRCRRRRVDARPRHGNLDRAEAAGDPPLAMTVQVTRHADRLIGRRALDRACFAIAAPMPAPISPRPSAAASSSSISNHFRDSTTSPAPHPHCWKNSADEPSV